MRGSVSAAKFLAMRSDLLTALSEIDDEITFTLSHKQSHRAAGRAKELFAERRRVCDELLEFDIVADPHPAIEHRG